MSDGVPQFATAEYSGNAGEATCKACGKGIGDPYYQINGAKVCSNCAHTIKEQIPQDSHAAFGRGVLYGVGGAILGLGIYVGFALATGLVAGLVSLAVGWLVGKAIVTGSGGVGGRRYQLVAALLTYMAVSLAAVPIALSQDMKQREAKVHAPASEPAAQAPKMSAAKAVGVLTRHWARLAVPCVIRSHAWTHWLDYSVRRYPYCVADYGRQTTEYRGPLERRHCGGDPLRSRGQECSRCAGVLAPNAVVCSSCHTLVHAATLEQLAAGARLYEEEHRYAEARDIWLKALELLPPDSAQAQWIRTNTEKLNGMAGAAASSARPSWAKKLGPFAPLAIVLAKGKFFVSLFKLKFLFSLGAFVAFYWALYGMKFGIGFALLILVHEMGHFIAIKRRGLPADMPVFLPGLGAYVRWAALGVSVQTRAFVSLAGPLAGMCRLGRVRVAVDENRRPSMDRARQSVGVAQRAQSDSRLGAGRGTGDRRAR